MTGSVKNIADSFRQGLGRWKPYEPSLGIAFTCPGAYLFQITVNIRFIAGNYV